VDANGVLLACGAMEAGQVGMLGLRGSATQTSFTAVAPTPVPSMAGIRVRAVVYSEERNVAVSEAGQVFACGRQPHGQNLAWSKWQPPVPTVMEELRDHRVRQVVASDFHCAALTEDGALLTWQTRRVPQAISDKPVPELGCGSYVRTPGLPFRVFALEGTRITSVAVGDSFTVAVTEAGAVHSFGIGDVSLGHGGGDQNEGVYFPKRIEALDGVHVDAVAAGTSHALALTRCGRVYSWGADGSISPVHGHGRGSDGGSDSDNGSDGGDKGDDSNHVPQLITALLGERVRAIAAGPDTSCAVTNAGALYTWGENHWGNLGHGDVRHR
jgi:alpha-tubulin suppressor-like RCC1 family protein